MTIQRCLPSLKPLWKSSKSSPSILEEDMPMGLGYGFVMDKEKTPVVDFVAWESTQDALLHQEKSGIGQCRWACRNNSSVFEKQ